MNKKLSTSILYFLSLVYFELIFKIFCTETFPSLNFLYTLIYLIPVTLIITIVTRLFKEKINYIISKVLLLIITLAYGAATIYKLKLGVFFSINSLGLANQLASFVSDTINTIIRYFLPLLLLFIPFILSFILRKFFDYNKHTKKYIIIFIIGILLSASFYTGILFINKDKDYSAYKLHFEINNHAVTTEKLGVLPSLIIEIRKKFFKQENDINNIEINNEIESTIETTTYNAIEIDFDDLNEKTDNQTLITMNEYFKAEEPTNKNKYTGLYEGKNLILFMAESFNSIGISKDLTPTLYKLTHEGFVFENFYSPVILSTIGGEFQELTGLYPNIGLLSNNWRKGKNYYPYGLGNIFNNLNYQVQAYHNNTYNFQNRDTYLNSLGFSNYIGCRNGLEKRINCNTWPQSDTDMINTTIDDYVNSDKPFMTYYVTVSGHMNYNWHNAQSLKHKDKVDNLPYSEAVKAYLATQIELDRALELLIKKLEESGKLDDTVIALVGDHYPYDLPLEQINEVSTYERDNVIEINHSSFILWNNKQETITIRKVGSQIDVLPTLLNIFGVEYDSRLIIGKDILSDTEGLAIFSNNSWISDQGRYYSSTDTFIPNDDVIPKDNYVENMNKEVNAKVTISKYIIKENYYKYLFQKAWFFTI